MNIVEFADYLVGAEHIYKYEGMLYVWRGAGTVLPFFLTPDSVYPFPTFSTEGNLPAVKVAIANNIILGIGVASDYFYVRGLRKLYDDLALYLPMTDLVALYRTTLRTLLQFPDVWVVTDTGDIKEA